MLAVGGAYSTPGNGPFPANGLIPPLKPLYDYSWAIGLAAAVLLYLTLSVATPQRHPAPVPRPAGAGN